MHMNKYTTRLHSSRMRTVRLLPVSPSIHCAGEGLLPGGVSAPGRVATAQGKQGIWFLLFPDRKNTGNFALTQGKILRHRENIFR